ncbi:unnamed protein product [Tilletia caries]|nr:unnamed protein product [Tilletia caries]
MCEARNGFSTDFAKGRNKFKKKREGFGTNSIEKAAWVKGILHPRAFKFGRIRDDELIDDTLAADTHIMVENGEWYISVPKRGSSRKPRDQSSAGTNALSILVYIAFQLCTIPLEPKSSSGGRETSAVSSGLVSFWTICCL